MNNEKGQFYKGMIPWNKDKNFIGFTKFPELRHDINNGITLCHFHHPRKREDEINLSPYFKELVMNVK